MNEEIKWTREGERRRKGKEGTRWTGEGEREEEERRRKGRNEMERK